MDLAAELVSGRFRRLLDLIEELPKACRWREAAQRDPDYLAQVEEMLRAEDDGNDGNDGEDEAWHPPASEFTILNLQMNRLIALLGGIANQLGADMAPDDYLFPAPYDPVAEIRAQIEQDRENARVENALARLLGLS